ncbi:MAG: hypothetical protein LQ352_005646 [Teloschistes flavicans]|nr:MAG: hypothetical protein LQ352_005646 [Teloschistes flavicans]
MSYSGASTPQLSSVPDLSHYPYYETSTESSPSPRMVSLPHPIQGSPPPNHPPWLILQRLTNYSPAQISYNSFSPRVHHSMAHQSSAYGATSPHQQQQMSETQYLLQQHAQQQQQQAALLSSSVEFTDLTAPVHEDRRRSRKGSTATMLDKQAISNMRIVRFALPSPLTFPTRPTPTSPHQPETDGEKRAQKADAMIACTQRRRAQNRASQRAFRERKEKHVQALETQLSALEDRHRELQKSHEKIGGKNERLVREVEGLKEEIRALQRLGSGASSGGGGGGAVNDFDTAIFGEDEMLESDFPF